MDAILGEACRLDSQFCFDDGAGKNQGLNRFASICARAFIVSFMLRKPLVTTVVENQRASLILTGPKQPKLD